MKDIDMIIDKLTSYNQWRRGDEDIPEPIPKEIGELIDSAIGVLERQRWRKVEEELPEEDESRFRSSLPVLTKDKYGVYRVAIYSYKYNDFVIGNISISVTEWKPIE